MKKSFAMLLLSIAMLGTAHAQAADQPAAAPPAIADPVTLKVSRQTLLTIGQALQELPAKLANPILNDLQAQLNAADKDAAEIAGKKAETKKEPSPAPDEKPAKGK